MSKRTLTRKITKFYCCPAHAHYFSDMTRKRRAEFFCEGGPGSGSPCANGNRCRIWPGTDMFIPEHCIGEADWPSKWAINTKAE